MAPVRNSVNALRRRRNRRNRRNAPPRRQNARPSPIVRNSTRRGIVVKGLRDLALYSKLVSGDKPKATSWLDNLWAFGTIAVKLFLLAFGTNDLILDAADGTKRKVTAASAYCSGVSQSIWIGAEDLLFDNAIAERVSVRDSKSEVLVPCLDYRQAIVRFVTAIVSSGSPQSQRAGRVAAAFVNVTEEELEEYKPTTIGGPWRQPDSWSFSQVAQMPGSVVAPYGTAFRVTWRATANTYSRRALALGQRSIDGVDFTKNLTGGIPVCRLVLAYQDLSTNDGSVSGAYSPSEFILQVQLRGNVQLVEPGRVYIRSAPITSENPLVAGLATENTCGAFRYQLPLSSIIQHEGRMYILKEDVDLASKSLSLESMVMD